LDSIRRERRPVVPEGCFIASIPNQYKEDKWVITS